MDLIGPEGYAKGFFLHQWRDVGAIVPRGLKSDLVVLLKTTCQVLDPWLANERVCVCVYSFERIQGDELVNILVQQLLVRACLSF